MAEEVLTLFSASDLRPGQHLCWLYESDDECRTVLTAFARHGLRRNEKIVYVVDSHSEEEIGRALRAEGMDIERAFDRGQIDIYSSADTYLAGGTVDPVRMFALIGEENRRAQVTGFTALRICSEMTWLLRDLPGATRWLEYEFGLHELAREEKLIALCQYDLRRFPSKILIDVLRNHPVVMVGTTLHENFYYIPSYDEHHQNIETLTLNHWIGNLAERKQSEQELALRNRELLNLQRISEIGLHTQSVSDAFREIVKEIASATGFPMVTIESLDVARTMMVVEGAYGLDSEAGSYQREVPIEKTLSGHVVATGRPLVEAYGDERKEYISDYLRQRGMQTFICVPMIVSQQAIGALSLAHNQTVSCDNRFVQWVASLANHVAFLVARKRAEEALRLSEDLYRTLVETSPDGIALMDLVGNFIAVNHQSLKLTGYNNLEELQASGKKPAALFIEEDRERVKTATKRAYREGFSGPYEYRLLHTDGTSRPVEVSTSIVLDADNKPTGFISITRDITERKRTEEALRQSEDLYRLITTHMSDGVSLLDLNLRPTYISPSVLRLRGFSLDEMVAMPLEKQMPPSSLDTFLRVVNDLLTPQNGANHEREIQTSLELEFYRRDGSTFWSEVHLDLIRNAHGDPIALLLVDRDISERRIAEQERDNLEEQLRHSQKMDAIGRLASGVAHDFNNILTGILGYSELIISTLGSDHPLMEDTLEIRRAAERATSLTQQLLAFSRKQPLSAHVLDLNGLVQNSQKMLTRVLGEDLELKFFPGDALGLVRADPYQIEQILINLSVNAREAMPAGGKLTLETNNVYFDQDYCRRHPDATSGDYVMVAISDSGCGMSDTVKQHLFEPFFTTKPNGKGTGLGLSTVYGIVKQSNGIIQVYSEVDIGTTFKIYFPRTVSQEKETPAPKQEKELRGTETVMIVEDDFLVRKLAARILSKNGYRVLEAINSLQALTLSDQHPEPINMLLSDVIMPEMNGRELYVTLKQHRPDMRVLFMSGYTDKVVTHHGLLDGNAPFIAKPFTPSSLTAKVREVLDAVELKTQDH
jgi:two-component system cell cycle sensor histidine kinase/response regulator CckA